MKPLVEAYAYLGTDCDKLQCQSQVAKNMHQAELSSVTVENVMEKLVQMQCAFPDLSSRSHYSRLICKCREKFFNDEAC